MQTQKLILIGAILSVSGLLQAMEDQKTATSVRRVRLVEIEESREDDVSAPLRLTKADFAILNSFAQEEIMKELKIAQQIVSLAAAVGTQGHNVVASVVTGNAVEAANSADKESMISLLKARTVEYVQINRVSIKSALGL